MDNRKKLAAQKQAERQRQAERRKYMRIQRGIRICVILLALVLSVVSLFQSCSTKQAIADLAEQLHAKKLAQAQEELQALQAVVQEAQEAQAAPSPIVSIAPTISGKSITLSFVGNCTLATDEGADYSGSFEEFYKNNGAPYFFQNVKSIFEGDDLTVANLEGTFTLSDNRAAESYTFKADPSHVTILAEGCIDAVNLANNHSHDYGNESYVDTLANLNIAGINHFGYDKTLLLSVDGIAVGLAGVYDQDPDTDYQTQALANIQLLKAEGAQIIIVELDWSGEAAEAPEDIHQQVAHAAIDAGADLVIGHHPHMLQGIELYKGKYIAYSLGDFCSGASSEVYDTVIFQQTFTVVDGKCQKNPDLEIIPCSTSTQSDKNTYCPTPAEGDEAQRILDKIYTLSSQIEGGIAPPEDSDDALLEALPPSPE